MHGASVARAVVPARAAARGLSRVRSRRTSRTGAAARDATAAGAPPRADVEVGHPVAGVVGTQPGHRLGQAHGPQLEDGLLADPGAEQVGAAPPPARTPGRRPPRPRRAAPARRRHPHRAALAPGQHDPLAGVRDRRLHPVDQRLAVRTTADRAPHVHDDVARCATRDRCRRRAQQHPPGDEPGPVGGAHQRRDPVALDRVEHLPQGRAVDRFAPLDRDRTGHGGGSAGQAEARPRAGRRRGPRRSRRRPGRRGAAPPGRAAPASAARLPSTPPARARPPPAPAARRDPARRRTSPPSRRAPAAARGEGTPAGSSTHASIWLVASTRPCSSRPTLSWMSASQCAFSTLSKNAHDNQARRRPPATSEGRSLDQQHPGPETDHKRSRPCRSRRAARCRSRTP